MDKIIFGIRSNFKFYGNQIKEYYFSSKKARDKAYNKAREEHRRRLSEERKGYIKKEDENTFEVRYYGEFQDAIYWYVKTEQIFDISNEEINIVEQQIKKHNDIVNKVFGKNKTV